MGPSLPPWLQVSEWSKMWFTNRFLFLHPWVAGGGLWKAMWPRLLWWQMSKTVSMLEWWYMWPCYGKLHVRTWLYWETVSTLYWCYATVLSLQAEIEICQDCEHLMLGLESIILTRLIHKKMMIYNTTKKKLLFFNMCVLLHGNCV